VGNSGGKARIGAIAILAATVFVAITTLSVTHAQLDATTIAIPAAAPSPCTICYDAENGHYYEYVSDPAISWQQAKTQAAAATNAGAAGYLATVTSTDEFNFINSVVFSAANFPSGIPANVYVGGSDSSSPGTWKWVTGPEGAENSGAGLIFYSSDSVQNGLLAPWDPHDSQGQIDGSTDEYYLYLNSYYEAGFAVNSGTANDNIVAGGNSGYLVEFPSPPTPTPAASATPTATSTATLTPTATGTQTVTETATATSSATSTATVSSTPTASATATSTATATGTPTATGTIVATGTATATSTASPTATVTATATAAASRTATETATATGSPTPTATATSTATTTSSPSPSATPTATAKATPTATQTATATPTPTPVPVKLKISSAALIFGTVKVGSHKGPKNVTVINPKSSKKRPGLTVLMEGLSGAVSPYSVTNGCDAPLPAGGKCTIGVTFAPTTAESYNATLTIIDNAEREPQLVKLKGKGKDK
jgi:hypothetical protein